MTTTAAPLPDLDTAPVHTSPSGRRGVSAGRRTPRPLAARHLTDEQVAALGGELDALRDEIVASRGAADAAYIKRVIKAQRTLELGGRGALLFSANPIAWVAGTGMLSVAKILENMEIGHNVLHGQWDWMRDPDIHSTTWEWDFVAPADGWKHTHNDVHHTWTNVVGKDRDVGYSILRMSPDQPWKWWNVGNPLYNALLAPVFEWGIAIYDLELDEVAQGRKSKPALRRDLKKLGRKMWRQFFKDYLGTPGVAALTGSAVPALVGTLTANTVRNVWAHAVIFCGHFPDGADQFTAESVEGESRGDWYVRQMLGSANISGSKTLHLMTGNLSHQIEHHLYPDLPSNRYAEIAPRVRAICDKYALPYTTGPMWRQVGSSWARVFRLALP
jgi:linoleoyl-CoA desaturase